MRHSCIRHWNAWSRGSPIQNKCIQLWCTLPLAVVPAYPRFQIQCWFGAITQPSELSPNMPNIMRTGIHSLPTNLTQMFQKWGFCFHFCWSLSPPTCLPVSTTSACESYPACYSKTVLYFVTWYSISSCLCADFFSRCLEPIKPFLWMKPRARLPFAVTLE